MNLSVDETKEKFEELKRKFEQLIAELNTLETHLEERLAALQN